MAEFWAIGHKMFKDTPESFPVTFVPGDAFDDAFLAPAPIAPQPPTEPLPDFATLTTFTPLQGRISAIHAGYLFHLFDEERQLELAKRVASLLSPEPGSFILGAHGGRPQKGARTEAMRPNAGGSAMFCHSPESWEELWTKDVFGPGQVKVDVQLVTVERPEFPDTKMYFLEWSVTRL